MDVREIVGEKGWLESKWTRVDGLRMHARVSANPVPDGAPHVILVHGIGISSRYFHPTAVRLAPEYRTYAPDLPGFGLSDKPRELQGTDALADWLAAWMRAYGIERAALVGNSYGCQIVVDFAVRHPELTEALALVGPTTDPQGNTAIEQFVRWQQNEPNEPRSKKHIALRDYLDCGVRRIWGSFASSLADHIERWLPHVAAPTLVIRGSLDPIVPQRWAEEAARLLPKGRVVVIPGARHTINFISPVELIRVLRPFFRETLKPGRKAVRSTTTTTTEAA